MSEHHYHLTIKDLPEEYIEKYPDFVRITTKIANPIKVDFVEPHTLSLCGVSCDNYDGTMNLDDVVDFLLTQVAGKAYGYPIPEKTEFLQYCELEEETTDEQQVSQA